MAKSEARRQKQLVKKKAKRDERRSELTRQNSDDPTVRLASSEAWPIVAALIPQGIWRHGMGQVILARRCPDGRLAFAAFLVDRYCLGVKNAYWKILSESAYHTLLRRVEESGGAFENVTPERLAKFVYAAVDYAKSLGIAPHPDYRSARMLLAGIDATQCPDVFEFGKDGKPFYIQGPNDSPEKMRSIMQRIRMADGDYLVGVSAQEAEQLMDDGAVGRIIEMDDASE